MQDEEKHDTTKVTNHQTYNAFDTRQSFMRVETRDESDKTNSRAGQLRFRISQSQQAGYESNEYSADSLPNHTAHDFATTVGCSKKESAHSEGAVACTVTQLHSTAGLQPCSM